MEYIRVALFLLPCLCAWMGLRTGRYGWNCAVTGGCMVLVLLLTGGGFGGVWPFLAALTASLFGDWCLSYQRGRGNFYLLGIVGFFVGHAFYLVYTLGRFAWNLPVLIAGVLLLAGYGLYLFHWAMPRINRQLRAAVAAYACISVLSLAAALGVIMPPAAKGLYILGLLLLVFSDTMIAESDFMGHRRCGKWIMPTYYACHIAMSMAVVCASLG